jgi:hypothetical protein
MPRKAPSSPQRRVTSARIAWLGFFAIPVILLLGLCASAGPALGDAGAPVPDLEAQLNEGDESEAECVEEAEELEADAHEAEELCEESDESEAGSDACPLRNASGHAAVIHDMLKVTIGYTANEPTAAKIQIHSGHGSETFKRQLSRSGVLRFTEKLTQAHGTKIVVSIEPMGRAGCPSRRLVLFPH